MRSRSTLSGPVHRIVFGTAVLLGIGSVLTFAASQQPGRAVANPIDMGVSYVTYGEATYPKGDPADGYGQEATPASSAWEDALDGIGRATSGVYCCVSSGGSCGMFAGSGCPSGSTQTTCPCNPSPM